MSILTSAVVTVAAASSFLDGSYFTGKDLAHFCTTNDAAMTGYVAGITDDMLAGAAVKTLVDHKVVLFKQNLCLDTGTNAKDLTDLVCKDLAADPSLDKMAAAYVVRLSLMKYICH